MIFERLAAILVQQVVDGARRHRAAISLAWPLGTRAAARPVAPDQPQDEDARRSATTRVTAGLMHITYDTATLKVTLDEFRQTARRFARLRSRRCCSAPVARREGDWDEAHRMAQDVGGTDGAWVHAYLHRKEGDLANARYWYRRRVTGRDRVGRGRVEADLAELLKSRPKGRPTNNLNVYKTEAGPLDRL